VEIWIAQGTKKDLRKTFPFIRDFAVIDIKDLAISLGYLSASDLDEHQSFILSSEIQKKLTAISSSKRFYRVLYLVDEIQSDLPQNLLRFSLEAELNYDKIFLLSKKKFDLHLALEDFHRN
jgi:hypothetical protein